MAQLGNARLKLERAKHHINDIERQWASFRRSGRGVIIMDNPQTGYRGVFVESDETLQRSIGLSIGDAVHNLHSALDHIIWALVSPHNPPTPERVQFPFATSPNGLVGSIANRQVQLAGPELVKAVNEVEPYPGGKGDDLVLLHNLDILDKHRVISATLCALTINMLDLRRLDPSAPPIIFSGMTWIGGPIISWPTPKFANRHERRSRGIAKSGQHVDATLDIIFGKGQPFADGRIVPTLVKLAKKVGETIERFEAIA